MIGSPTNEANFVIEISAPLYDRIKQELGDAFIDNCELHYSPYWKMMNEKQEEDES